MFWRDKTIFLILMPKIRWQNALWKDPFCLKVYTLLKKTHILWKNTSPSPYSYFGKVQANFTWGAQTHNPIHPNRILKRVSHRTQAFQGAHVEREVWLILILLNHVLILLDYALSFLIREIYTGNFSGLMTINNNFSPHHLFYETGLHSPWSCQQYSLALIANTPKEGLSKNLQYWAQVYNPRPRVLDC